jgi:hypothetical protein
VSDPKPIWECKIGILGHAELPEGCDAPMRAAVRRAFREVAGVSADFIFSGWSAQLDEAELAIVENRYPEPSTEQKEAT